MASSARILMTVMAIGLLGACAPVVPPQPPPVPPADIPTPAAPTIPEPAQRYSLGGEPTIDVGLRWDVDTLTIAPIHQVSMHRSSAAGLESAGKSQAAIRVSLERGGAIAKPAGGDAVELAAGDTLFIGGDPVHGQRASRLLWNGRLWRGTFKVFMNPRGKLTLASRLPLEAYLLGVIPGEIGGLSDELMEAGRAQAIAARSYTLFYMGRRADEGFDLYSTVEDQVYGPVESERPLASRVVESTRAVAALSEGCPIRANYSSTCGGMTADVWEAWPADPMPYLIGHRDGQEGEDFCRASRHYRWEERFSAAEWQRNMRRFCPERGVPLPQGGVGELLDVRVGKRSRSGRAWELEVITTNGMIVIPAHELRWVVRRAGKPGSILRSTLIKVDVRRDPKTRRPLQIIVSGAGSGHGVGLCQTGALGMSRAGIAAEDILTHYYQGTDVRSLY